MENVPLNTGNKTRKYLLYGVVVLVLLVLGLWASKNITLFRAFELGDTVKPAPKIGDFVFQETSPGMGLGTTKDSDTYYYHPGETVNFVANFYWMDEATVVQKCDSGHNSIFIKLGGAYQALIGAFNSGHTEYVFEPFTLPQYVGEYHFDVACSAVTKITQLDEFGHPKGDPKTSYNDTLNSTGEIVITVSKCGDGYVLGGAYSNSGHCSGNSSMVCTSNYNNGQNPTGCGILYGPCIPDERCDDGNNNNGDGCSSNCAIENGYYCDLYYDYLDPDNPFFFDYSKGHADKCFACGDGKKTGSETCDDGNTNKGDGCSDKCTIESGWTCPTVGAACVDNNECLTNNGHGNCDPHAECINTPGWYSCGPCPSGYTGAGNATCTPVSCGVPTAPTNGAVSDTSSGSFGSAARTYSCNTGYTLIGSATATCQANGAWTATPTCAKRACPTLTAPPNGTVSATTGVYQDTRTYTCSNGFVMTGFSTTTCQAGGTWSSSAPTCTDINECLTNNGGCDLLTTCTNTLGSRTCTDCPAGYTGNGATGCNNVNECTNGTANCGANSTCTDTPGSYACACVQDYSGDSTGRNCVVTDKCLTNNGGCDFANAICASTGPGTNSCTCKAGYSTTDNGITCTDVNECAATTPICGANSDCTNTPAGSYACTCKQGFVGSEGKNCAAIALIIEGDDKMFMGQPKQFVIKLKDANGNSLPFDAGKMDISSSVANSILQPVSTEGDAATATSETFKYMTPYAPESAKISVLTVNYLDSGLSPATKNVTVQCEAGVKTYPSDTDALNAALNAYDISKIANYSPTLQELKDYDFDCNSVVDLNDALNIYDVSKAM